MLVCLFFKLLHIILYYVCSFQGHPRLINALSKLYSSLVGRDINPQKEILVTVGAYEALYCTILGFVNPGDEVIFKLINLLLF